MQVAFWIELLHAGCLLDHNFFMQVAFWIGFSSHKLLSGSEFLHAGCLLDQKLKLLDQTIYMLWFPFGRYCHLTGCLVDWNFFIQVTFWRRTSSYRLPSQSKFLHAGCLLEKNVFMQVAIWIGISRLPSGSEFLHADCLLDENVFMHVRSHFFVMQVSLEVAS